MTTGNLLFLPILLVGCPAETGDDKTAGDTANPDDSGLGEDTGPACEVHLTSTEPASGAAGVYYRAPLVLTFDGDAAAATIAIRDAAGVEAEYTAEWSAGNVQATLAATLAASTDYTLSVAICGASNEVAFSTSEVGEPVTDGAESLMGRVYAFALNEANITNPEILEAFDDQFFTQPILLEVTQADAATITLLGAMATGTTDEPDQAEGEPTFDFPAASFEEQPYFYASTPLITITYMGVAIPINDFAFSGVFAADGSEIVYGEMSGLVDTRTLGPLVAGVDDPGITCEFAETYGIYCEACPDGEEYCLQTHGDSITAPWIPDLDIVVVE